MGTNEAAFSRGVTGDSSEVARVAFKDAAYGLGYRQRGSGAHALAGESGCAELLGELANGDELHSDDTAELAGEVAASGDSYKVARDDDGDRS